MVTLALLTSTPRDAAQDIPSARDSRAAAHQRKSLRPTAHTAATTAPVTDAIGTAIGSADTPAVAVNSGESAAGARGKAHILRTVRRYQPLLYAGFLAAEQPELVLIERPWLAVMEQFPPTLYRVRYGT